MITVRSNIDMVLTDLISTLELLDNGSELGSEVVRAAAITVSAEMKHRIQNKGLATDGTKIGSYSTSPLYVSTNSNVGRGFGRPIGKTGLSVFKSGKKKGLDHLSRYFEKGYSQYKTAIGRNTLGSVNLTLTGQMMGLMSIFKTTEGWGIGWDNVDYADRARYFEGPKKYGKPIFDASQKERLLAVRAVKRLMNNALS
jgi:hypothetical protein